MLIAISALPFIGHVSEKDLTWPSRSRHDHLICLDGGTSQTGPP
jgi:hypothetical protein